MDNEQKQPADAVGSSEWLGHAAGSWNEDPLYDQAVLLAKAHRRLSYSILQRSLLIGFNRAARLLEAMEQRGVVKCVPTARDDHWQIVA